MPKPKPSKPILKLVPPSPWLEKTINGVPYWVHKPSRKCGIHIRGLARLCGVHKRAIENAIKNAKKVGTEVAKNYKTELNNLLKDKHIFLEEVAKNSPGQQGGPVKVICADVCGILIRYYAEKGHEAAIKSAIAFMQFGIEQFIFIQVGFIPIPESIILNDIEFLIAKETVQVNKSRQEEARFFTNPITGECGIDLKSLSFLCGGVAVRHIEEFLKAQNEPFLNPEQSEPIVKAAICAATLQYFGEVHKPRKTLAQQWNKILDPIVPVLHQKTNYQAPPRTDRENQMEQQLIDAHKKIAQLEQLVQNNKVQGNIQWHRIMARLLQKSVPYNFFDMHTEVATNQVTQLLDVLIIQLYAVTALYPQTLASQAGTNWQTTEQTGVYRLLGFGLTLIVIVANQISAAPHNLAWNLLSHDPELIRYALSQSPLPEDLLQYFET